ncbi:MAG: GGDEF domain-containing protein [Smithellaceae bacterium]|nr:GGDEF domain-containing protein [Smithellaceae bacterium]
MMNRQDILPLVELSLLIDRCAEYVYDRMAHVGQGEWVAFWSQMATDERDQIGHWRRSRAYAEGRQMEPIVFHNLRNTLEWTLQMTETLFDRWQITSSATDAFVLAYCLEAHALDPEFQEFLNCLDAPAHDSHVQHRRAHAQRLDQMIVSFDKSHQELQLCAGALRHLWRSSRILVELATIDAVTGLLNRRGFSNLVGQWLRFACEAGEGLGLMMVDIDDFRLFNETRGRLRGDEILGDLAQVLKKKCRSAEVTGRFGGDEFAIFFRRTNENDILANARVLQDAIQKETSFTVSIGAVHGLLGLATEPALNILIHNASQQLEQAKGSGQNGLAFDAEGLRP